MYFRCMILVTGATGLVGSHLMVNLLLSGEKVRAIVRDNSKRSIVEEVFSYYDTDPQPYLSSLEWYEADLLDVAELEGSFAGITQVYHAAALLSFQAGDAERLLIENPEMTANVVNLCIDYNIEKLVYVSSVAALGRKVEGELINETSEWVESANNSYYARSKYKAELEVWRGTQEGLNAVIINPCIILGPGNWDKGSNALFSTIANGFKFYSEGVNAYVDVRDVVKIMMLLMKSDISGERFVVASENRSYKDLFGSMARALSVKAPFIEAKPWMSELVWRWEKFKSIFTGKQPSVTKETAHTAQRKYYYDNSRIKERLAYEFIPLDKTIEDMVRWKGEKT